MRFLFALFAAVSFAAMMPTDARAQFGCVGAIGATDVTCTNTGIEPAVPYTQDQTGVFNLTINNAGTSNGIVTSTVDGNNVVNNSGTDNNGISLLVTGTGNATLNNSGTAFILDSTTSNGNSTITNGGLAFAITNNAQNGAALTQNFGQVLRTISTNAIGGDATTVNSGNVQNLGCCGPGISTKTDIAGNATTINAGIVAGGIETITGSNVGGGGNATTINTGIVLGDVYTSAADQFGGSGVDNALLFNSGTIVANFTGVQVLTTGGNAGLVNYGMLDLRNAPLFGHLIIVGSANGNASAYNAGRIFGELDVFAFGGTATLSNAGLIDSSSTGGRAIDLFSNDPTSKSVLNLLPGSRIIGEIGLNGNPGLGVPATTVNIFSGADISSVTTFGLSCGCGGGLIDTGAPVNVFGGAPFVIFGNTVAVLDPTSFAVQDKNIADFSHTISSMITSRLNNPASMSGGSTPIGFAPSGNVAVDMARDAFAGISSLNYASTDRVLFSNPSVTAADGTSVWAQGFVGQRIQDADAPTLRSVNNFYGGMMGVDKTFRPGLRIGGLLGAGSIKSTIDLNSGDTKSDIVFGGLYGRYAMNQSFVDFALLGGHSSNDLHRNMANNLVPGGLETAYANYNGWFISPEIAYGVKMPVGTNLTLTPTARVRYLAAGFGSYQESGSTTNLTVASRTSHNFEERGEVTLTKTSDPTPTQRMQISGTLGLLALQRVGDTTVNTILLGQNFPFATPGKNDVFGGYGGVGFDWRHISGWTVFGAAEYTATTDSSRTATAKGGVKVEF